MSGQSTRIERSCEKCGKKFFPLKQQIKNGMGRWCSRSCHCESIMEMPLKERFEKFLGPQLPNGCIPWTGSTDRRGYGHFGIGGRKGKTPAAHRVAWEIAKGPIPDGLWVLHRCDNPNCVNAEHLFLGSHADNMKDMKEKGRAKNGASLWKPTLTASQVLEIRRLAAIGEVNKRALSRKYGVSANCIRSVINRKTWKHLPIE